MVLEEKLVDYIFQRFVSELFSSFQFPVSSLQDIDELT